MNAHSGRSDGRRHPGPPWRWLLLSLLAVGCSSAFIEKRPLSWQVMVVDADKVSGCESKGGVKVGAAAYLWIVKRRDEDVEDNLLQLARNAAVDAGGDTLVKGDSPGPGTRNFSIYRCLR